MKKPLEKNLRILNHDTPYTGTPPSCFVKWTLLDYFRFYDDAPDIAIMSHAYYPIGAVPHDTYSSDGKWYLIGRHD